MVRCLSQALGQHLASRPTSFCFSLPSTSREPVYSQLRGVRGPFAPCKSYCVSTALLLPLLLLSQSASGSRGPLSSHLESPHRLAAPHTRSNSECERALTVLSQCITSYHGLFVSYWGGQRAQISP